MRHPIQSAAAQLPQPLPALPALQAANDELVVLVVNEQADILDEVAALLARRGLPVVVAHGAAEANALLRDRPGIGVVVAGVSLLEGAGLDLAAALLTGQHRLAPAELLLLAGYEGSIGGPVLDRLGVLREPLTPRGIEQAVHQALGRAVIRLSQPQPRPA